METNKQALLEQRKIKRAKYAIEDFDEAVAGMNRSTVGNGLLALFMLISIILGAANIPHLVFSLISAAAVVLMAMFLPFKDREAILFGVGIYLALFFVELFAAGVPDTLIPSLDLNIQRRGGILQLINGLSPYVYLGCRLVFSFVFFLVLHRRNQIDKHPKMILRQLGFESV